MDWDRMWDKAKDSINKQHDHMLDVWRDKCRNATDRQLINKLHDGTVTDDEYYDILVDECRRRGIY